MYLLAINEGNLFGIALISLTVYFVIFYSVIKSAVFAANKESNREIMQQLKLLNQFKVEEMKASGMNKEDIQKAINKALPTENKNN
jgi:hypothetical protein